MDNLVDLAWLIPALPLAGFAVLLVLGRRLGDPLAGWVATLALGASFVVTVLVVAGLLDRPGEERHVVDLAFTWLPAGGLHVDASLLLDPLSLTMALFVTGVGTLIHLYSVGYMHGDARYPAFFTYLNLFAFSMLLLVLGENLLLTFLGWEGVGACSYFLISFWFTSTANASAGKKAFVTNRVGDVGFMLAMFLVFQAVGSLSYGVLLEAAPAMAASTVTAVALLLFAGACGKSAQLPLYVWLPDAMAGPTPVSALIHAATMVTAGVYLMVRVAPLLEAAYDWVPTLIAVVGVLTALFAATIAVAQNDIKRVLAYSTISQLGYMFLAVGSGAYVAAVFHMVTHAFFKALLFLGAGSVIHGMHDEQDMRRMGGLRRFLPVTAATFIVGWLAIAGVPPFAGFWSKDEILSYAWQKSPLLWVVGLVTALLTAFYMSRQVYLVFFGDPRWQRAEGEEPAGVQGEAAAARHGDEPAQHATHGEGAHGELHPHEAPWTMAVPLVVLAGLSIVGGGLNLPFSDDTRLLERWLAPVVEEVEVHLDLSGATQVGLAAVSALAALAGIVLAAAVYLRHRADARRFEPDVLRRAWRVDELYAAFMGGPGRRLFDAAAWFDRTVVDGAVNGVATVVRGGGSALRTVQTGFVRSYALGVAAGAIVLVAVVLARVALT
ncbi:MAG TPA: NADH-quinone oxidoreductase subunit L [Acidimicrobiales bacterium]